jgi:hypothetical protein
LRFRIAKPILAFMTELDQVWSQMLAEAGVKADEQGHRHIVEYLRLRATNDAIRSRGVAWLIDAFIEIATDAQRDSPNISIERVEPHSFAHGNSTMVGTQLVVRHGVRCLTLEAGWARIPSHGIMRNGALAVANIVHFGLPKAGAAISLVHGDDLPQWIDGDKKVFEAAELRRHIDVLLAN